MKPKKYNIKLLNAKRKVSKRRKSCCAEKIGVIVSLKKQSMTNNIDNYDRIKIKRYEQLLFKSLLEKS